MVAGSSARMNVPGQAAGWHWLMTAEMLSAAAFDWLRDLMKQTNRSAARLAAVGSMTFQATEVTR